MQEPMTMQGALQPGLLLDIMQYLSRRGNHDGFVIVKGTDGAEGKLWTRSGALIAASWRDRQGEAAVEFMMRLQSGQFEVRAFSSLPDANIWRNTVAVLMDCTRDLGKAAGAGKAPSSKPAPVPGLAEPLARSREPEVVPDVAAAEPAPSRKCQPGRWVGIPVQKIALAATILLLLGILYLASWPHAAAPARDGFAGVPPPTADGRVVVAVPAKPVVTDYGPEGWPVHAVSGLIAIGRHGGCAILNGQLVEAGGQVDGITVRAVRSNGVILEYQGRRRFIAMERSMAL